jgi:hypothetical protein
VGRIAEPLLLARPFTLVTADGGQPMTPHERLQRAKDLLARGRPSTTTLWPHRLLQLAPNEGAPPEARVSRGELAKAALDLGLPCARIAGGTGWVGLGSSGGQG